MKLHIFILAQQCEINTDRQKAEWLLINFSSTTRARNTRRHISSFAFLG